MVKWEPLSYFEQNGEGFHYVLKWRVWGDLEYTTVRVYDPTLVTGTTWVQHTVSPPVLRYYKPHEVTLQAVNNQVRIKEIESVILYMSFETMTVPKENN